MRRKTLLTTLCALAAVILVMAAFCAAAAASVPGYAPAVGYEYSPEKVKGRAIIKAAADSGDTLFLFGSSELSTTMIESHPANFFTQYDFGFNLCTVGRGSSQSLIHALILAGNGDSLKGKKIVFLISPQHFVEEGIEPDMFVANFSEQQFLAAMESEDLSKATKLGLAGRVRACFDRYEEEKGDPGFESSRMLAGLAGGGYEGGVKLALIRPYLALEDLLFAVRDDLAAAGVMKNAAPVEGTAADFDWEAYRSQMASLGAAESDNNDFGILNDYYDTNVGKKLGRMAGKDADLSYSKSVEYGDLELLIQVCRELDIDALFVSTPLHGAWSDYCGFTADRRQEYYGNVREILQRSGYEYLDLTDREYEPYYLCDVMHLGWLGWVDINEAVCKFYNENQ